MRTLALILLPAIAFAAAVWLALAIREGRDRGRPWWGEPVTWIVVSAVFVLVGVVVAPRLLGFTFLFLPFLWVGRSRRGDDRRRGE